MRRLSCEIPTQTYSMFRISLVIRLCREGAQCRSTFPLAVLAVTTRICHIHVKKVHDSGSGNTYSMHKNGPILS